MLGDQIGEGTGKVTAIRSLPSEGSIPKQEISFQGSGIVLGIAMNEFGTFWQTINPGGEFYYAEGQLHMITTDGEAANGKGIGVGKLAGRHPTSTYSACSTFVTNSAKLARLNTILNVIDYQMDEKGNYTWKMWEWKPL